LDVLFILKIRHELQFLACPARLASPILRIQTCDLRLRSWKNELIQQVKQ